MKKEITVDGKALLVEYRKVCIGDTVAIEHATNWATYITTIHDADNLHWVVISKVEEEGTPRKNHSAHAAVAQLNVVIDVLCMHGEITQAAKGLLLDQTKNITTEIGMIP